MAITHTYVDFATGNDYKGASFTDGAFTVADMTLTKAGAFAASKVNHWLYLRDNGSGRVTTGYYRIASVTSADAVVLATSPKSGATDPTDVVCVQHDGTTAKPWRSVQGALDLKTRDATNGDQVNIQSDTPQLLAETLSLVTYGTPTLAAPLVIRGYTTVANDGGRGAIRATGAWSVLDAYAVSKGYINVINIDLSSTTSGDYWLVRLWTDSQAVRCSLNGVATGGGNITKGLTVMSGSKTLGNSIVGFTGEGLYTVQAGQAIMGNYIAMAYSGAGQYGIHLYTTSTDALVVGNIVSVNALSGTGIAIAAGVLVLGNALHNRVAGGAIGIYLAARCSVLNNIISGWSAAGGKAIYLASGYANQVGYNAFYNNTANYAISGVLDDLTGHDVTLVASPFVDAANGDFSLTATAKAALRGVGWPTSYLGAHTNTDGHITIGPIQYGEAEAGGGGRRPWLRQHGG